MSITTENILLVGSLLLIIAILAGKVSHRFGVPTLVFFLATGMLAGSEGIGGIYFDNPKTAQFIGIVALNFILFSGGLDTRWRAISPILWKGLTLSSLGVLITAVSVGVFVWYITDFTIYEGLLLGSIVSSTDAAAVFSILRSNNLDLKHNLRPILELESGSNDPMAYFLTIAFTGLVVNQDASIIDIIPAFVKQITIGVLFGFLFGELSKRIINRIQLGSEGLYPVLVIALMFLTFSVADTTGGNGFLAIYICSVYLGNQDLLHKRTIIKAFDGFAWLMQIVLFLTLGLLVFPTQILPLIGIGLLISAFLILVARPLSVFASLWFFRLHSQSLLFVSWVGLRGAVPIVFATYPLLAGVEKSQIIFDMVFFISLTSVLIQGTTLPMVANWLQVAEPEQDMASTINVKYIEGAAKPEFAEFRVTEGSPACGKRVVDLHFPQSSLIALIKRNGKYISPSGSTILEKDDVLTIIAEDPESLEAISGILKF
ncbi:potassium/proton antiporter [Telluribacter sp. SYSU D00476]|uniref:potassium/proton antiporter n=1 Tax=Telluribacter sp. SYSU D00476 TaxID=2811430 RepID=UPI001FF32FCD|nr:potassium/proton antiporter [Telluribacter sp. SYSU D00476]